MPGPMTAYPGYTIATEGAGPQTVGEPSRALVREACGARIRGSAARRCSLPVGHDDGAHDVAEGVAVAPAPRG